MHLCEGVPHCVQSGFIGRRSFGLCAAPIRRSHGGRNNRRHGVRVFVIGTPRAVGRGKMFSHGAGSELRQPLGYAMVGGLALSQLLTLVHHAGGFCSPTGCRAG